MHKLDSMPETLQLLKNCPKELFYLGDNTLLDRKKISIVGSRKPTKYSRQMTQELASKLSKVGVCVVSGGAMGIDAMAHNGAGSANTIAVLPCGLEHKYPAVNAALLCDIEKKGLLLSQFAPAFRATAWSF
ncbi:MAG: DNA-processing protein DprA, partial [Sulfurimonas sp.]